MHYVVEQFNIHQLCGMIRAKSIIVVLIKDCYDQDKYITDITRSNTFDKVGSNEISRYLVMEFILPFLNSGIISAIFRLSGTEFLLLSI